MKAINYIILSALLLLAVSCGNKSERLQHLIDEHPSMVVRIDMARLCAGNNLTNEDGVMTLPVDMRELLDEQRHSYLARVMKTLPASGIDHGKSAYIYSASPEFNVEILAPLRDAGAAEKWVCSLCNENGMQSAKGIDYVTDGSVIYAIEDDVLFVGVAKSGSNIAHLTEAVAATMNRSGKSLADNKAITETLAVEGDAVGYFAVPALLKQPQLRRMNFGGVPVMDVLGGMEVEALAVTVNLSKTLDMEARVIAKPTAAYKMAFGSVVSKPSADVLDIMPASLGTVLSVSLRGNVVMQMQPVRSLVAMGRQLPIVRDFDFEKIVNTIDGPVAVGVSNDRDFIDSYNVVVAMASTNTDAVIGELDRVAEKYGKHAQQVGNERVYEYFNQRITVGVHGGRYVYFEINTEDIDDTPVGDGELRKMFAESPICASLKGEELAVMLAFESSDKIVCRASATEDDETVLLKLLKELCRVEATKGMADDYGDDSYGGAMPIDELTGF